jgi:hypothetical protein
MMKIKLEAAQRILADIEDEYTEENKRLSEEKKNATPERKKDISRRQQQIKDYKDAHKDPYTVDHTGMETKPEKPATEAVYDFTNDYN